MLAAICRCFGTSNRRARPHCRATKKGRIRKSRNPTAHPMPKQLKCVRGDHSESAGASGRRGRRVNCVTPTLNSRHATSLLSKIGRARPSGTDTPTAFSAHEPLVGGRILGSLRRHDKSATAFLTVRLVIEYPSRLCRSRLRIGRLPDS